MWLFSIRCYKTCVYDKELKSFCLPSCKTFMKYFKVHPTAPRTKTFVHTKVWHPPPTSSFISFVLILLILTISKDSEVLPTQWGKDSTCGRIKTQSAFLELLIKSKVLPCWDTFIGAMVSFSVSPELTSNNPMLDVAISGLSVMSQSVPVISTGGGINSGWLLLSYSWTKRASNVEWGSAGL